MDTNEIGIFDGTDLLQITTPDTNLNVSASAFDNLQNSTTLKPTSSPNTDTSDLLMETKAVLFTIQYFLLPLFLVTGLIGNLLTVLTMASRHFSEMTSRYILIALAISDTVVLLTQPFNKLWVIQLLGTDFRALSSTSCKTFFVIYRSAKMTSSWLVVLLCFERFIAVVFPFKAKLVIRKRTIFPAIAINYISMLTYNSIWFFSSQIVGGKCKPEFPRIHHKVFVVIGSMFYSIIPTFLLIIFTPKIIFKLSMQVKLRRNIAKTSFATKTARNNKNEDDMIRASYMVLGVMIAYIILIIPITLVHLIALAKEVSAFDETTFGFFVFKEIAQMLEQVNYAVNFFFYTMCSRLFRSRVLDMLCMQDCRSRGITSQGSCRENMKDIQQKTVPSVLSSREKKQKE